MTAVRGEGAGQLDERTEGIEQKKKQLRDTDNSRVMTRGHGGWREVEDGKGRIKGNEED